MLCSVHGTSGTLMGAVLCIITKSVTYRPPGCVHAKEACSAVILP